MAVALKMREPQAPWRAALGPTAAAVDPRRAAPGTSAGVNRESIKFPPDREYIYIYINHIYNTIMYTYTNVFVHMYVYVYVYMFTYIKKCVCFHILGKYGKRQFAILNLS